MAEYPLNSAQQQAVDYIDGPLLIVAGAGTGKTTVITKKIAHIVDTKLAEPEHILALTFTDKAAEEMQDRVDEFVDIGYTEMKISTFHTFCQELLQEFALDIGIPNNFKLMIETDTWMLVRQHIYDFNLDYYRPLGNPNAHIHALLSHFSKCKDELITPQEYLAHAEQLTRDNSGDMNIDEKTRITEIANAYHTYTQLLLDNSALDFGDLIYYTVKLLEQRPQIQKQLQQRFKYILVDEFQDVNWAQYVLVQMLANEKYNQLTVVGDDDQSIYAFRGASVSNILRFKEDFPTAKNIVLNTNYRSNQQILDIAYTSIQHNNPDRLEVKLQIDKKLVAGSTQETKTTQSAVTHIHGYTIDDEVGAVLQEIQSLKKEHPETVWDDFCILVRANGHADPFINGLETAQIPYEFLASAGLYRQPIVLDAFNFLKLLDNYHEHTSIYRLLRLPFLNFKESDMQKLVGLAKKKSISYYEALKRASGFFLSPEGIATCNKLVTLIHTGMKQVRYEKPSIILYNFFEDSGYLNYLTKQEDVGDKHTIRQIYQLKQFFDLLRRYEDVTPDANVVHFVEQFEYMKESGNEGKLYQPTDTPDSVNIMTIHASKGLEFKYVFMINMVEDRFPTRRRGGNIEIPTELIREQLPEGDEHVEEERRLFYVAATRAKEKLYFISSEDYGGSRKKKISRFLAELDYGSKGKEAITSQSELTKINNQTTKKELVNSDDSSVVTYNTPKAFSFSQIQSYQKCPYQYKLSHILNIPKKGAASFSFGSTMHNTLQKFYEQIQEMNSAKQPTLFDIPNGSPINKVEQGELKVPTLNELFEIYKIQWIDDWYKNKTQRESYQKKGKEILKTFYTSQEESGWTIPVTLEGWFKIVVGDHLVHGRIDRIDKQTDGSLEIIDYKTGKTKEKLVGEDKEQLLIYQIAAESLPQYRNLGPVGKLTFYYLNDNVQTSFTGKSAEIEKLKTKLTKTIENIKQGDFTPTPDKFTCQYCDYRDICEYRAT
ncbi:MAG: ATP-dependent helicase [Candidatus Magasanikbacteria bacterium]|uniref:DNA 3'-5' helicase n=1 Tax=Candidatus Magasanikbacteria bacterium CG10_big_fil_rev_8_21_14_0_10_38_6 TaxID=1974647 RepID=A0A2M6P146_9BACT|nr:ATP-dependent helicase [Candidatus Magasanikbacteria bacterium]NCS72279.1 ATP-dependent helicase [Candidatus Magasanikbacteria bacterium]PIR77436.1 MAG: hypothetical protein COU30_02445 [Candidatus Magasanikbacteria bacterium CG10_big_fil_rev_8_21_14_0_10_38_6]